MLTLLTVQQVNKSKGWDVEARATTLFTKLADGEDGKLMSQNNYQVLDARFFNRTEKG